MTNRVGITGIGLVTPVGNDMASSWQALTAGQAGIGPITLFDASRHDVRTGGEGQDFDPLRSMDRKEGRRNGRFQQFAIAAAREAIADAKLDIAAMADDVGVIIGSGSGGLTSLENQFHVLFERGPDRISPFFITMMVADMATGAISMMFGARGPNYAPVSACATGANAIGEASEIIRRGDARAMLAGGTEAGITSMTIAAFDNMHALSHRNDEPQRASRPFEAHPDGFVSGEGAGILVLEDLLLARGRGPHGFPRGLGHASTSDAHHITEPAPGGAGLARALRRALTKAQLRPEQVEYINAHGTSTKYNDRDESAAIRSVFGEHASRLAVSSTKAMTGHLMGAGGRGERVMDDG